MSNKAVQSTQTLGNRSFDQLTKSQQDRIREKFFNWRASMDAFNNLMDSIENFQVKREGDIAWAYDFALNELLEQVRLPYTLAYITTRLDDDAKKDFLEKKHFDLIQAIVQEYRFQGKEQGKKLHKLIVAIKNPLEKIVELQAMAQQHAKDNTLIESEMTNMCVQMKTNPPAIEAVLEEEYLNSIAPVEVAEEKSAPKSNKKAK